MVDFQTVPFISPDGDGNRHRIFPESRSLKCLTCVVFVSDVCIRCNTQECAKNSNIVPADAWGIRVDSGGAGGIDN